MKPNILSISDVTGKRVENLNGRYIGEIQDIMIEPKSGRIAYAVLSFGGFLGIGDKYFAVPVEALDFSVKKNTITLDVNKEKLKNAPGFDKNNWPVAANEEFIHSVYDHYGFERQNRQFI